MGQMAVENLQLPERSTDQLRSTPALIVLMMITRTNLNWDSERTTSGTLTVMLRYCALRQSNFSVRISATPYDSDNVDFDWNGDETESDQDDYNTRALNDYYGQIEFVYSDQGTDLRRLENGDERSITAVMIDNQNFDGPYAVFIPSVRLPFPNIAEISQYLSRSSESFVNTINIMDGRTVFSNNEELRSKIREFLFAWTDIDEYQGHVDDALELLVNDIKQSILLRTFLCANYICKEVISENLPTEHSFFVGDERSERRSFSNIGDLQIDTIHDTDDPITLGDLSSGTQCLLWIWHIAIRLNEYFIQLIEEWLAWFDNNRRLHSEPFSDDKHDGKTNLRLLLASYEGADVEKPDVFSITSQADTSAISNYLDEWWRLPFILVIDEIENHLHPTWQRRVIPALLEYFPNVQIIATTHSPFVVAGLKAGQVHLLNRDADGVVTASTNTEDIVGWTADEILRTMMGVDDPTDDETARHAAELRRLRDEGPRDTEDAEAARQGRMQELRRLVDRDLLAGGPAAAQRELFEQQFAEALEKYQRSRDLGQDSG